MTEVSKSARPERPPIGLGSLEHSLEFFVTRANTILLRSWTSRWADSDLRPRFYHALALIGANPGIALVEVAKFIAIDKSGGSEVIDYMVNSGFIVRKRSSWDHRRHGLYLTPWGARRLAEMHREVEKQAQTLNGLYTEGELRKLIELLQRLPTSGKPGTPDLATRSTTPAG
jgi:DNA-binding MarR family transcriptional regulator